MAKQLSEKTLQSIVSLLKLLPEGAAFEEIIHQLKPPLAKRTLQRYLSLFVEKKLIIKKGKARAVRYFLSEKESLGLNRENKLTHSLIDLSPNALAIKDYVQRPIHERHPVSYKREFLNRYHPNKTHYLSLSERKHLLKIGKSPDGVKPAGTYAKEILNRLLIDLSWNSSRLEGNTYSLLETERLLALGEVAEGKNAMEAQMILNHKAAIEFLVNSAEHLQFDSFTILNLHALLSENLLRDPRACGSLRTHPVKISKSVYQPLAVPQLIQEYFQQILDTANAISDPFEQSFFVMVHLPYLQPFLDVNKLVSRLAANISLIKENLCPLSFVDVPEKSYINALLGIYELNRIELYKEIFLWAYERSSSLYLATRQEIGEPDTLRLKYRHPLHHAIKQVVQKKMNKQKAVSFIKEKALELEMANDRPKFIELCEKELMSLHEGNIARFQLSQSEYRDWLKKWK